MWLFKKKKEDPVIPFQENVEMLVKREKLLMKNIEVEHNKAKEFLKSKNESGAKIALKKKKNYQSQLDRLQVQIANLQEMQQKLEEATIDKRVLDSQKAGAKELKKIYKESNLNKIEKDLDDIRETMDIANEISESLAQSFSLGNDIEDEFDELKMELEDEQLSSLTEVPKGKISGGKVKKDEVEDELSELEAQFA